MDYCKNLSLAQKLGLVDRPDLPLGLSEWKEIEAVYLNRSKDEKENICPICLEDLQMTDQRITCCSHVFHHKCLESLERIAAARGQPVLVFLFAFFSTGTHVTSHSRTIMTHACPT